MQVSIGNWKRRPCIHPDALGRALPAPLLCLDRNPLVLASAPTLCPGAAVRRADARCTAIWTGGLPA